MDAVSCCLEVEPRSCSFGPSKDHPPPHHCLSRLALLIITVHTDHIIDGIWGLWEPHRFPGDLRESHANTARDLVKLLLKTVLEPVVFDVEPEGLNDAGTSLCVNAQQASQTGSGLYCAVWWSSLSSRVHFTLTLPGHLAWKPSVSWVVGIWFHSTRWFFGLYNSLSSSIARLLGHSRVCPPHKVPMRLCVPHLQIAPRQV